MASSGGPAPGSSRVAVHSSAPLRTGSPRMPPEARSRGAGDGTAAPPGSSRYCLGAPAALADCGPLDVTPLSATPLPGAETRTYPCISWCSAEQKLVQ